VPTSSSSLVALPRPDPFVMAEVAMPVGDGEEEVESDVMVCGNASRLQKQTRPSAAAAVRDRPPSAVPSSSVEKTAGVGGGWRILRRK
jgi:hypothetical protein